MPVFYFSPYSHDLIEILLSDLDIPENFYSSICTRKVQAGSPDILVWELLKSTVSDADKKATLDVFDAVFGLALSFRLRCCKS